MPVWPGGEVSRKVVEGLYNPVLLEVVQLYTEQHSTFLAYHGSLDSTEDIPLSPLAAQWGCKKHWCKSGPFSGAHHNIPGAVGWYLDPGPEWLFNNNSIMCGSRTRSLMCLQVRQWGITLCPLWLQLDLLAQPDLMSRILSYGFQQEHFLYICNELKMWKRMLTANNNNTNLRKQLKGHT